MRGAVIALVVLAALTGCKRREDIASQDTRTPPSLGPRFYPPEGWAWGTVAPEGSPAIRYGVSSTTGTPRATVILLAGGGEPAETYFETARDLIDKGFTVWILDPAPRPTAGAQALRFMVDNVVRPRAGDTVVVAAYDSGVLAALLEAETQRPRVSGLVLWSPKLAEAEGDEARKRVGQGLGAFKAAGEHDWIRPDHDLSGRATLADAWRTANPDLRPKPRPWNWFLAQADAIAAAADPGRVKSVDLPVLVLESGRDDRARTLCTALPRCVRTTLETEKAPPHLASDRVRGVWLAALTGFVEDRIAGRELPAQAHAT